MGACFSVLGINLWGDAACRDAIREDREDRKEIRQTGHTDRVDSRQEERTNRNYNRNYQQAASDIARQYGTAPGFGDGLVSVVESGNEALADIFGGQGGQIVAGVATGGMSTLFTGLLGGTDANGQPVPMSPIVPICAIALLGFGVYQYNKG